MPKTTITIEYGKHKRSYDGDYVFAGVVNKTEVGGADVRWVQQPANWEKGMGVFLSAIEGLKIVAAAKGDDRCQIAARAALSAMETVATAGLDPDKELEDGEERTEQAEKAEPKAEQTERPESREGGEVGSGESDGGVPGADVGAGGDSSGSDCSSEPVVANGGHTD